MNLSTVSERSDEDHGFSLVPSEVTRMDPELRALLDDMPSAVIATLEEHAILTLKDVRLLTKEDLEELGFKVGTRNRILDAAASSRSKGPAPPLLAHSVAEHPASDPSVAAQPLSTSTPMEAVITDSELLRRSDDLLAPTGAGTVALAPDAKPKPKASDASGPKYPPGSRVIVPRSDGSESLAFVLEADPATKMYKLELEHVGSGKTKRQHESVLREVASVAASTPASDRKARAGELADKLRSGKATSDEKAEFSTLVTSLKKDVDERSAAESRRRDELTAMKMELDERTERRETATAERRKREVDAILDVIESAEAVDLCFLLDSTGSMARYIDAVKDHIRTIVRMIRRCHPLLKLRVAFVAYRDPLEGERGGANEALDFVEVTSTGQTVATSSETGFGYSMSRTGVTKARSPGIAGFEAFVSGIRAHGGGDGCEDVAGGFSKVLALSWRNETRVLFHVGDAPCHGADFNDGVSDNHAHSDHGIIGLLQRLKEEARVEYYFAKLNDSTNRMVRCFNSAMCPSGLGTQFVKTTELSKPEGIVELVSSSVKTSITHSATRIGESKKIDVTKIMSSLSLRAGA